MDPESSHFRTVVDSDGAAILDVNNGIITTLNPTGSYVWQRLQRGDALEAIVADLANETGQDTVVVNCDVRAFIETLKENKLLSW